MTSPWMKILIIAIPLSLLTSNAPAQIGPLPPLAPPSANTPLPPVQTAIAAGNSSSDLLPGQVLYNGGIVGDLGIGLSSWGGGTASLDNAHAEDAGKHSIQVESPGFYQGGGITFANPVTLGNSSDKTKYLQFSLMLTADPKFPPPAPTAPDTQFGQPGAPGPQLMAPRSDNSDFNPDSKGLFKLMQDRRAGEPGHPGTGGNPFPNQIQPGGPMIPAGPPQQVQPGPTGTYQPTPDVAPPPLPASNLHIVLTFADGSQTDINRQLPTLEDNQDWFTVGVPLSKLTISSGAAQPTLVGITFATDNPTLINIGAVALVTDSSPIVASAGGDKDISVNEEAVFQANVTAGASTLEYQWDFDTHGNFEDQADGPHATHTYPTAGTYKVTLKVTDVDDIKAPVLATSTVTVE